MPVGTLARAVTANTRDSNRAASPHTLFMAASPCDCAAGRVHRVARKRAGQMGSRSYNLAQRRQDAKKVLVAEKTIFRECSVFVDKPPWMRWRRRRRW